MATFDFIGKVVWQDQIWFLSVEWLPIYWMENVASKISAVFHNPKRKILKNHFLSKKVIKQYRILSSFITLNDYLCICCFSQ